MALGTPTDIGTADDYTSGNTTTLTTTVDVPGGAWILVAVALGGSTALPSPLPGDAYSAVDDEGNEYVVETSFQGVTEPNHQHALLIARNVAALPSGSDIAITHPQTDTGAGEPGNFCRAVSACYLTGAGSISFANLPYYTDNQCTDGSIPNAFECRQMSTPWGGPHGGAKPCVQITGLPIGTSGLLFGLFTWGSPNTSSLAPDASTPWTGLAEAGTNTGRAYKDDWPLDPSLYPFVNYENAPRDVCVRPGYQAVSGVSGTQSFKGTISGGSVTEYGVDWHGSLFLILPGGTGGRLTTIDRGPDNRLRQAQVVAATSALNLLLHTDALPEAVGSTTSVETTDCQSVSFRYRRAGIVDLLYTQADVVKHRTSRDQGGTFSVATTIATGYQAVTHAWDEAAGILVAALYKASEERWYVTVGTLDLAGTGFTWSSPVALVSSATGSGDLRRRSDGVWEFGYITNADAATIIRARSLNASGAGAWS